MIFEGFYSIASPMMTLTQKKAKFIWSEACQKSFPELKHRFTSALVLTLLRVQRVFWCIVTHLEWAWDVSYETRESDNIYL